jgi:uncharacterized protein YxjI
MKNFSKALVIVSLIQTSNLWAQSCPQFELPRAYVLDERVLSIGTNFVIKAAKQEYGRVDQKVMSVGTNFYVYDKSKALVAHAHKKIFTWGTDIQIYDCHEKKIGRIRENIVKSLFKIWTTYSIEDAVDHQIAKSEKIEFITPRMEIMWPEGGTVATLKQTLNPLEDIWEIQKSGDKSIDERILVVMGAFKSHADKQRRKEAANKTVDQILEDFARGK